MRVALASDAYKADIVAGGCALVQDKNPKVVEISHSSMPLGQIVPLPLNRLLDIDGCWLKGGLFLAAGGLAYFFDDFVMRECLAEHGTPPRCSCAPCYPGRGLKLDVSFHIGRQPQYQ